MIVWDDVHTVLLDMDGTILDLYFDNHFWLDYLPRQYASRQALPCVQAEALLKAKYDAVKGTLDWYCLDYWCAELDLDVVALKHDIDYLIQLRPAAQEFLAALVSSGREVVLVTNAHRKSLELKMEKIALEPYFNQLVSAHDLGLPKEDPRFWARLQERWPYDPEHTLLVDDNETVLESARECGIAHLFSISEPDMQAGTRLDEARFPRITHFDDMMPIPKAASA